MKNTTNTHSMKSEAIYLYVEIILNWLCHVVCFFKWFDSNPKCIQTVSIKLINKISFVAPLFLLAAFSFAFTINNTSIFVFVVFVVIAMVIFSSQNSTTHSFSVFLSLHEYMCESVSFPLR